MELKNTVSTMEITKKDLKIIIERTLTKLYYTISKNSTVVEQDCFYACDTDMLYDFNKKVKKFTGYSIEIDPLR